VTPKDEVLQQIDALIPTGKELDSFYRMGEMGPYFFRQPEERFRALLRVRLQRSFVWRARTANTTYLCRMTDSAHKSPMPDTTNR